MKLSGEIVEVENEDDSKSSISSDLDNDSSCANSYRSRKKPKMPFVSVQSLDPKDEREDSSIENAR